MDPARLTSTGQPDFVVVTGLSGSGKSQAAKVLEDLGYYTLDNLPPALMASAIDVSRKGGKQKVAFVIDARSGSLFADAKKDLEALDKAGTPAHVLFFAIGVHCIRHRHMFLEMTNLRELLESRLDHGKERVIGRVAYDS